MRCPRCRVDMDGDMRCAGCERRLYEARMIHVARAQGMEVPEIAGLLGVAPRTVWRRHREYMARRAAVS